MKDLRLYIEWTFKNAEPRQKSKLIKSVDMEKEMALAGLGVEKIPRTGAEGNEFLLLLLLLSFRAIPPLAKRSWSPLLATKRWRAHVALILFACAASAAAAAAVDLGRSRLQVLVALGLAGHWRRRRRRLVAPVVHDARKKVIATAGHVLESFLGRPVFAWSGSLWVAVGVVGEAGRRERVMVGRKGVSGAPALRCKGFASKHV